MRRQLAVAAVAAVGLVLSAVPAVHLVIHTEPLLPTLVGKVLPLGAALLIVGAAGWLHRSRFEAESIERIAAWCLIGLTSIGFIGSLMFVHIAVVEATFLPAETVIFGIANVATGGALAGIAIGVYDARTRRQRKRLQRERDRLDEFASIVSHDLQSPLTVASGNLDLAREECDSDRLNDIADAHERMDTLLDDLLTMAREGTEVTDPDTVDLGKTVDRCWKNVASERATLTVDTDHVIRADESRLKQLLENLLRNSVEHGSTSSQTGSDDSVEHADGAVTVTVGDLADGFYVEDDGPGIPEDKRDRVFEPGYTTRTEGTGLGLNIVKSIADAHGWTVTATESAGGGARFEITGVDTR